MKNKSNLHNECLREMPNESRPNEYKSFFIDWDLIKEVIFFCFLVLGLYLLGGVNAGEITFQVQSFIRGE